MRAYRILLYASLVSQCCLIRAQQTHPHLSSDERGVIAAKEANNPSQAAVRAGARSRGTRIAEGAFAGALLGAFADLFGIFGFTTPCGPGIIAGGLLGGLINGAPYGNGNLTEGGTKATADVVDEIVNPATAMPLWLIPPSLSLKIVLTTLVFGFDIKFPNASESGEVFRLLKTAASSAARACFVAMALYTMYLDTGKLLGLLADGACVGLAALFYVWSTSANTVTAVALWLAVFTYSPYRIFFDLVPKYKHLNGFPLWPCSAKWLPWDKHLYALLLLPYYAVFHAILYVPHRLRTGYVRAEYNLELAGSAPFLAGLAAGFCKLLACCWGWTALALLTLCCWHLADARAAALWQATYPANLLAVILAWSWLAVHLGGFAYGWVLGLASKDLLDFLKPSKHAPRGQKDQLRRLAFMTFADPQDLAPDFFRQDMVVIRKFGDSESLKEDIQAEVDDWVRQHGTCSGLKVCCGDPHGKHGASVFGLDELDRAACEWRPMLVQLQLSSWTEDGNEESPCGPAEGGDEESLLEPARDGNEESLSDPLLEQFLAQNSMPDEVAYAKMSIVFDLLNRSCKRLLWLQIMAMVWVRMAISEESFTEALRITVGERGVAMYFQSLALAKTRMLEKVWALI